MGRIHSMVPIVNEKSRILILGTMPGTDSLKEQQYYCNVDNLFWDIMFRIFSPGWPMFKEVFGISYEEREQLLLDNEIALWDILKSCEREGNTDSKIRNEELNDIQRFLYEHPNIKNVYFNGDKAHSYYLKNKSLFPENIEYKKLYSTSSSSTINSFFILREWKHYLGV